MHVAELNIGRLNYPIDDPRNALLKPVHAAIRDRHVHHDGYHAKPWFGTFVKPPPCFPHIRHSLASPVLPAPAISPQNPAAMP